MIDASLLLTQLNNTGLQNKNTPLYQFLKSLIESLKSTQTSVTNAGISTVVNNAITQNVVGVQGQDGLDAEDRLILVGSIISPMVENETPGGAVNSSNKVFTTAVSYQPGQLLLYLNGVRQKITIDYTETSSNSFTFVVAPTTGDILLVDYGVISAALVGPQGIQGATGPIGPPGPGLIAQDGLDADNIIVPGPRGTDGITTGSVASVYRATNQTMTGGVETAISWSTVIYDLDGCFSIGSPTKLTVQKSGTYSVVASAALAVFSGTGAVSLRIYKNGSLIISEDTGAFTSVQVAAQLALNATDFVEIKILITDNVSGTHDVVGGITKTTFAIGTLGGPVAAVPTTSALVLLEQHAASNSASLDFTAFISSLYDEYIFEFVNLVPATDNAQLWMRMSTDGGATYDSGTNYSNANFSFQEVASAPGGGGTAQVKIIINGGYTNTANYTMNGHARLFNPSSASLFKSVLGDTMARFSAGDAHRIRWIVHGQYDITTAVNAVRFLNSAGNITSGTIRVYGLTH